LVAGEALLLVTGRVAAFVRVALGVAAVLATDLDFGTGFATAFGAGLAMGLGAGLRAAALTGLGAGRLATKRVGAGRAGAAAFRAAGFAAAFAGFLDTGFRAPAFAAADLDTAGFGAARLATDRGAALATALTGLAFAAGFLTGDGALLARADEDLLRGDVAMCDETPATQRGGSRTR
jgi:hypothetical protein